MPERHRLPAAIATLSECQGVFVDTRSPKVFAASLSVVSNELLQNCHSAVALVREPQEWWNRIETNGWKLVCDGKTVITLEGHEMERESTISSGPHVFEASWFEQQQFVYGGH